MIEAPGWARAGLDIEALATRACDAALRHLGLEPEHYEISLLAADDARIRALNAQFRGKDRPTNVLSWPADDLSADDPGCPPALPAPGRPDDPESLGDIALALETCLAEARAAGKPAADHVTHLLVHGLLHLLGYDHETEADALLMEGTETAILDAMGIADPYAGSGIMPDSTGGASLPPFGKDR